MKKESNHFAKVFILCLLIFSVNSMQVRSFAQRPYFIQKNQQKKHLYYYYPQQNIYFYPKGKVYFIWGNTQWNRIVHLPSKYETINRGNTPKFELVMVTTHPYYFNADHRKKYANYRLFNNQKKEYHPKKNKWRNEYYVEINPKTNQKKELIIEEHYVVKHIPGHFSHPKHNGHKH
ncbi:hypothetical protein [Fluviicola taffensis]|uniref:Uncharacterized protein n=1 Tax=Fluviicola taffensis (strain DSM 16823 / NCIMB 13979 / RW262) TaxID=755732 RepID=F2IJD0_FLUTR|nr:hypothetical protein [Fluviicola taffensis]AEA46027.1 hypothetical protein Fluta_4065 [Fluviicola taffensis DSM 16823]